MDIVFLSNFYNHHQKPLCEALSAIPGVTFTFVETEPMPAERRQLGYQRVRDAFVLRAYEPDSAAECRRRILAADVLLVGSCPEELLRAHIRAGKLMFRFAERPLRKGLEPLKYPVRFLRWHARNPRSKPIYLLCASAFTARDYALFGLFRRRAFQWGYYPSCVRYPDLYGMMDRKDSARLLWVGRLLELKHPEHAVLAAERLRDMGYAFTLDFIGTGPEQDRLTEMILEKDLTDRVRLLGAMRPEQVRAHMERSGIFLFNSDRREGWGAVLNEAMNSACAVVASHTIGAVPYLIRDGQNGLIYPSGDWERLAERIALLLDAPATQRTLGRSAYRTITETWNADTAAARFVQLCEQILSGQDCAGLFSDGPCSAAPLLREDWFLT